MTKSNIMDREQFVTHHVDALIAYAMGERKQAPEHTLDCGIWETGLCNCKAKETTTREDAQNDTTTD